MDKSSFPDFPDNCVIYMRVTEQLELPDGDDFDGKVGDSGHWDTSKEATL